MNCCNSCFGVVFLYSLFISLLVRNAASEASASELTSSQLVGKDLKHNFFFTSNLLGTLNRHTGVN